MNDMLNLDPEAISVQELQSYLQAAVAPRPIALASTVDRQGSINLSPFSFFNIFSTNPAILVFSPSRRVKDNTTKHTLENILEVPEVCINIVNFNMVGRMSYASNDFAKDINEFEEAGFESSPSLKIKPPRITESPVAFECVVDQVIPLGTAGGAGNLVIARIVFIHIRREYLDESGKLSAAKLDLIARLGGNAYCRVIPESLFEIKKPG